MSLLATLATIFGVVNGFANFPQIYKIFKTKSAKDLAISTYLILITGSIVWIFYGIEIKNTPILIMNGLAFFEFIIILIGCYLYGRNSESAKKKLRPISHDSTKGNFEYGILAPISTAISYSLIEWSSLSGAGTGNGNCRLAKARAATRKSEYALDWRADEGSTMGCPSSGERSSSVPSFFLESLSGGITFYLP